MNMARSAYFVHDARFEIAGRPLDPPAPGEVRVRIAYCGICGTDLHIFHGAMPHRLGERRILGHEASGVVEALGDG
ncbi:MAG: alcohol dehydrogenase catalytic domain-containing protein, partial [Pseudomonadota bacterium]